jgi:hypothetical protein
VFERSESEVARFDVSQQGEFDGGTRAVVGFEGSFDVFEEGTVEGPLFVEGELELGRRGRVLFVGRCRCSP